MVEIHLKEQGNVVILVMLRQHPHNLQAAIISHHLAA